jgi:hypothetical protein
MYFKPSGKVSLPSVFLSILAVIVAAPLLALAYTYAVWYIPFIYINAFIAFFAGIGMYYVAHAVSKYFKSRSKLFNIALAVLGGFALSYVNWAIWIDLVINSGESYNLGDKLGITVSLSSFDGVILLLQNPALMLEYAGIINETGTWGFKSIPIHGWFLTLFWVIEGGFLIGVPVFISFFADIEPFCEQSNTWAEKKEAEVKYEYINSPDTLKQQMEVLNYSNLLDLKPKPEDSLDYAKVEIYYLSQGNVFYMTVTNQRAKYDKEGKLSYDSLEIVKFIEVPKEICFTLLTNVAQNEPDV